MALAAVSQGKSPAFLALAGACALLAVLELFLLSRLFLADDTQALWAVEHAQRMRMNIGEPAQPNTPPKPETEKPSAALDSSSPTTEPEHETIDAPEAASEDTPAALPSDENTSEAAPTPKADNKISNALEEFIADADDIDESDESTSETFGSPLSTDSMVGDAQEALDSIPMEPRTNASLPAPYDALMENSDAGALPRVSEGVTPFTYYRRPFSAPQTPPQGEPKPVIALIVSDLGAVKAQTEAALKLPSDVSLAFNPYARHTPAWLESARNKGLEAWLMLPAQPDDYPASDRGPLSILNEQDAATLNAQLEQLMAKAAGYVGFLLPANEAFSDELNRLQMLKKLLDARGIALAATQAPADVAVINWFKRETPAYAADILIDEELTDKGIEAQLKRLEARAEKHGKALGVLRGYPLSLQKVTAWLEKLESKGFVLAPASALMVNSVD